MIDWTRPSGLDGLEVGWECVYDVITMLYLVGGVLLVLVLSDVITMHLLMMRSMVDKPVKPSIHQVNAQWMEVCVGVILECVGSGVRCYLSYFLLNIAKFKEKL